jgi:hypothetical protein
MCRATVKIPQTDFVKQDNTIGKRVTLDINGTIVYLYGNKNGADKLIAGQVIDVKKDGKYYEIKSLTPPTEASEDIYNSMSQNQKDNNSFEARAKQALNEWLIVEKMTREALTKLGYSMEDVRAVTTGIRIQIK